MDSLEVIGKVTGKIAPGPAPSFNEAHVVKTLETISNYGKVGRVSLSKVLKLGIGTTRTILKHLKKEGLIEGSKYGFVFSERGKKLFANLRSMVSEGFDVPNSPLTVGPVVITVLVKDAARKVRRGAEQRNTAIRAGARGATTLIFSDKKLMMASKKDHSLEDVLPIHDILLSKLNPEEDDVILLGSGVNRTSAEIGAIMAAIKLLKAEDVD